MEKNYTELHQLGGTLKAEISRTADMLEKILKEPEPLYFIVAFLNDIQYRCDDKRYNLLLEELKRRMA
jgi:hypothetical protein